MHPPKLPLAPVLLALTLGYLAFGAGSCEGAQGPELVKVLELTPHEAEPADRVTLQGEGFPAGRTARVAFRGMLRRPGEHAVSGAEVVTSGAVTSPEQVELSLDEDTVSRFCGAGDRAVHTTFEGDVVLSFAAAEGTGSAPVTGSLRHVVFDVRPSTGPSEATHLHEGERLLDFAGIRAKPGGSGLVVESVEPGSRGEAAQLEAGDVIASFDGVRVATAADVVPPAGEREASLGVRHSGSAFESPRALVVEGFRRAPPVELFFAALLVMGALLAVLLFAAPLPPGIGASLQRVVHRLRASGDLRTAVASAARECLPGAGLQGLPDALLGSVFALLPFGQYVVAAQLDVALPFVAGATMLVAGVALASRTPLQALRAGALVAWRHVPAAAAVATVVVTTGSLRVHEIARAQGGWPWEWLAFRHPAAPVALLLLLAVAVEDPPLATEERGLAALVDGAAARIERPWLDAVLRAHRLLVAGLAATCFLGGWWLPGISPATQDGRPWLELAGAALLLGKIALLMLLLVVARSLTSRSSATASARVTLVRRVPLALALLVVTFAWSWWGPAGASQLLVSCGLVVAAALGGAAFVRRVKHGVEAPEPRLSPFL
jgi:NADH-quinone oxidoreductase subunit H